MDWKRQAVEDLRLYQNRRTALTDIRERINALKESYGAIKTSLSDTDPVQGGSSVQEDRMLSNITERERLKLTYSATKRLVDITASALERLSEQERLALERFYVSPAKGNVDRLREELGYEIAHIYRLRDKALRTFTITLYGLEDY